MENGVVLAVVDESLPQGGALPVEDYSEDLTLVVRQFEEAEEATYEARQRSEQCRDYYDGKQLTTAELEVYRKRRQPPVISNYIKRKVDFLLGFERRQRTDPKAFPRNPQDEQTADAATDSLRFVADQNNMDEIRSGVFENMMIEGYGGAEVSVVTDAAGRPDVRITWVPWDRIYYDPHSRRADFSDTTYRGIVIWMDAAEARWKWPERADAIDATISQVSLSSTYDDRPEYLMWCDNRRRRVRIVQGHYQRGGEWYIATFTKGGFLEDPQPSPFLDKDGRSTSPLRLRAAYIDRQNNRYGPVRDMISLQDEVNKRRSKALHLLNTRQTFGNKRAVQDTAEAKRELAKPDGHLEINADATFGQDFGVLPTGDLAQGQVMLLQQATSELQAQGPNAALAGKDPRQQSGRAIQAQQQGGAIEMEPMVDGLKQWTRDLYEVVWMAIRQYWTDERWVRVTDDERKVRFVGLNQPITYGDMLAEMPPEQRAQIMQQYGFTPNDPRLQQVADMRNVVADLDVDIVIEEGPDVSTLQGEQFETLANLAQSGLPIPPKAIVMASNLRNKDQILEEMEQGKQLPPEVQKQMQELQQQLQQAQQRNQQLEMQMRDRSGELQLRAAELGIKARQAGQGPQEDPVAAALDAQQKIADIAKTRADTEQTELETWLLANTPTPPPFQGSVSA